MKGLESITIGQVATVIAFVVALIGGVEFLLIRFNKIFDEKLKPINNKIDNLDETTCKNYLVRFLSDVESGNYVDEIEKEHAYEIYDHYSKPKDEGGLGCNSYIHSRWEKSMNGKVK